MSHLARVLVLASFSLATLATGAGCNGVRCGMSSAQMREQDRRAHQRQLPAEIEEVFDAADTVEILRLDPEQTAMGGKGVLVGHSILSRRPIVGRELREELTVDLGLGLGDQLNALPGCFNPTRAIHLVSGGQVTDLLVSFECQQVQIFTDGEWSRTLLLDAPEPQFLVVSG